MSKMEAITCLGGNGDRWAAWGETTCIKGVVITPLRAAEDGDEWWDGYWSLIHTPTGRAINTYGYLRPRDLRDLAEKLAALCDDWTGFGENPAEWPDGLGERIGVLLLKHHDETDDGLDSWASP